jgi:DUF917 family protein
MNINHISEQHLDALALGFAILGSGGGSNPAFGKKLAQNMLSEHGVVRIISAEDLADDALIVPVSFMGAPLIGNVTKPTGREFLVLLSHLEKHFGRKPTALIAAEIGGSNGFSPLLCAGAFGIPIVDGDTIGRAFPELPMATTTLFNISPTPAFLTGAGSPDVVTIHELGPQDSLEQIGRQLAIGFGSKAALISDIMTGKQAKQACVRGSYSKAHHLGKIILDARQQQTNAIDMLVTHAQAHVIGSGVITELSRELQNGFVVGHFAMQTTNKTTITIHFKNENLIVYEGENVLATTPDIIIPLRAHDTQPLTVELLEMGTAVSLLVFDTDPVWTTPNGLALVGPRAFGFDVDYIDRNSKS